MAIKQAEGEAEKVRLAAEAEANKVKTLAEAEAYQIDKREAALAVAPHVQQYDIAKAQAEHQPQVQLGAGQPPNVTVPLPGTH